MIRARKIIFTPTLFITSVGELSTAIYSIFTAMARSHKITYEKQYSCEFESVVRGHHIYKRIWKPVVGEKLKCKHDTREEAQLYDEFAIGTYLPVNDGEEELVGHVPIELSFLLCKYLARDGCCLEFTPTGPRYLEDGLVVPGRFKATSNGKALICILKNELEKKAEKLKHMRLNVSAVRTINKILYF